MRKRFGKSIVAAEGRLAAVLLVALTASGCGGGSGKGKSDAAESAKKSAAEHVKRGKEYVNKGQKKKAIEEFSQAIQADPNCREAYVSRAMLYNETRRRDKALADYSKAIQIDPRTSSYPYEERAKIYDTLGRRREAEADRKMAAAIRNKEWNKLPGKRERFENRRKGS